MNTELINKLKQIESLTTEVIAMTQEKPKEHPFINGEHVQVRDHDGQEWRTRKFSDYNKKDSYPKYGIALDEGGTIYWEQCRRPVGVDNILIRWFGGECPVKEGQHVIVVKRDGSVLSSVSYEKNDFAWKWGSRPSVNDTVVFMTVNLGDK